ncbi:hypothetical protein IVA93_31250 [Bradyrhizobium sp. 155]|uniref:hypothetical protein n=1 Tax=unclassified Bradyrhizobium TaxID=2631580 RepID=UPI001FFAAD09|nr:MULTISPECIES: hypothetical protein [unclassified Bradyrhizobium]MCK1602910.1 hypothetical protein [Bradyrhizobium sp. 166]UPK10658.1 hypothetical protein IVA93_31250 [Bradyrhizobium sp. 155]
MEGQLEKHIGLEPLNETQSRRMAMMAKHPHTKINLISSLASRQDGVTQAELRKATGWKLVPMPLIAKRCKMKLITKREKGSVTRKNGQDREQERPLHHVLHDGASFDYGSCRRDYRHSGQKALSVNV